MADYHDGDLQDDRPFIDYFNGDLASGVLADYFNGDLVGAVLPVPVPLNVVGTVDGFNPSNQVIGVSLMWDAPETEVDGYQYREFIPQNPPSIPIDVLSEWTDISERNVGNFARDFLAGWIELRSVLDGRFSAPVRLLIPSDLEYPDIGVPQNFVVEIIEDETNRFVVDLTWDPPANAYGRTVRYFVDRGGTGFGYHNSGDRLNYAAARSLFSYFSVRAEASGEESAYVRVEDADYTDNRIEEPPQNVVVTILGSGHTADHISVRANWAHNAKGAPDHYEIRLDAGNWARIGGTSTQASLFVTTGKTDHVLHIRGTRGAFVSEIVEVVQSSWTDLRGQGSPSPLVIGIVDPQRRILRDPGGNVLAMRT